MQQAEDWQPHVVTDGLLITGIARREQRINMLPAAPIRAQNGDYLCSKLSCSTGQNPASSKGVAEAVVQVP
jgi:hypothetical protein